MKKGKLRIFRFFNISGFHGRTIFILLLLLLFISKSFGFKVLPAGRPRRSDSGDTCVLKKDGCGSEAADGLQCQTCDDLPPRCTRFKPVDPKTKAMGLPFNRYSWLTTHNSFSLAEQKSHTGAQMVTAYNQQDTVTQQLNNGVRGLMLDLYDFWNDIWLCHSFGGICYNFTAFQPAINVFREIEKFLGANPDEIITVFIEDYVKAPGGLTKLFAASGVRKYWFPLSAMPENGGDWPLLSDMIAQNHRLIVFTSKPEKEASEGIAFEWKHVVENQYGDKGMKIGLCPNRKESEHMNSTKRSLVVMNYFTDVPNFLLVCKNNSAPLITMLHTCAVLSTGRWPNYVAVDFYKKSDGGGASHATDVANGHLVCGCEDIASCKVNGTFGACLAVPKADTTAPPPTISLANEDRIEWLQLIQIGFMVSTLLLF